MKATTVAVVIIIDWRLLALALELGIVGNILVISRCLWALNFLAYQLTLSINVAHWFLKLHNTQRKDDEEPGSYTPLEWPSVL